MMDRGSGSAPLLCFAVELGHLFCPRAGVSIMGFSLVPRPVGSDRIAPPTLLGLQLAEKETSGGLRAVKRKTWVSKEGACTKAEAGVGERGGDSECGLTGALALSDGFGRGLVTKVRQPVKPHPGGVVVCKGSTG